MSGVVVVDDGDPAPLRRGRGRAPSEEVDDRPGVGGERGDVGGGAPVGEQRGAALDHLGDRVPRHAFGAVGDEQLGDLGQVVG